MKKKVATLLLFVALVAGCSQNEIQKELVEKRKAELQSETDKSMFKLGYRTGQMDTMQFYLDNRKFPKSADLNPDRAYGRVMRELNEFKGE